MEANRPALVIHGHFYQPPRENPWTGNIDPEPSAKPFSNWNARIFKECYRANAFAEILDEKGAVLKVVNNYAGLSFNFGPTLLPWLERFHPETYQRILEADRESLARCGGHGNAIAQAYVHAILPLCSERDERTLIRWGLAEFEHRFGRAPEALWLPETACNNKTLGALIDEGMKFVILSPSQAQSTRKITNSKPGSPGAPAPGNSSIPEWSDVGNGNIDTGIPYRFFHPDGSGRGITVFFYSGAVANAIAFEGILISSQGLIDRFEQNLSGAGQLVSAAVDGESFGHHFPFGERCLAYALDIEAPKRGFWITNFGEFLDHHPPAMEVEIKKGTDGMGTAWSCPHGLGRWYADCGCQTGGKEDWNQAWRGPLREALDFLRNRAALLLQDSELFQDASKARDEYIGVVLKPESAEQFLGRHLKPGAGESERKEAVALLEMQRNALLMYSSCGWFFADISGLEAVLVMKYAGRVLDYLEEFELKPARKEFLEILVEAKSNRPRLGTGADIFRRSVEPLGPKRATK